MKEASLLVERGPIGEKSQEWGPYGFLDLPSPGDRLTIDRDGKTHYLTVLCVHHRPVARLGGGTKPGLGLPDADVVAKWTGSN